MQQIDIAADAGEHAAEQIGEKPRTLDVDTEHPRALAVAADGIEVSAKARPFEQEEHQYDDRNGDHHAKLNARGNEVARLAIGADAGNHDAKLLKRQKQFMLCCTRRDTDDGRHPSCKKHAGERNDKRLNLEIGHQKPLHEAERGADAERKRHGTHHTAALVVEVDHASHRDQRRDAADGDIDPARDHDDGQSAGQND
ncbi:hypothetical protein SDC9_115707 [bioreactor metagenome]|uniref:Uncharacterized protein n=1 Tax=bioreactor metagenome TaxID=1076179 RepID=A0A645C0C5_9ZZZZ